jgi:hypothetical protein
MEFLPDQRDWSHHDSEPIQRRLNRKIEMLEYLITLGRCLRLQIEVDEASIRDELGLGRLV